MLYLKNSGNFTNYDFDQFDHSFDMSNKLFCTFSKKEEIDNNILQIESRYDILYNKIFILECLDSEDYIITYNIDFNNVNEFLKNTILVHRKKQSNTLYTINALNELIKKLNKGYLDKNFPIDWNNYKNSVLLTRENSLDIIKTKLFQIHNI